MIELRVLGGLDIRDGSGTELRGVLSQPKRVALLTYLAVRPIPEFHRRDTLLALFWPEMGTRQARAALRGSLHFLRRELGADLLVSRGFEEIGLSPAQLRCDAAEFLERLASGDDAGALERYRGDLLEGFFLSNARAWEDWLDREQARLRERAREAAWALVGKEEAAAEFGLAAQHARRALELFPDDEPGLRRLMTLLERRGDRPGALRAYREFAARLDREYELDPDDDTRLLAERIAAGADEAGAGSGAAPADSVGLGGVESGDQHGRAEGEQGTPGGRGEGERGTSGGRVEGEPGTSDGRREDGLEARHGRADDEPGIPDGRGEDGPETPHGHGTNEPVTPDARGEDRPETPNGRGADELDTGEADSTAASTGADPPVPPGTVDPPSTHAGPASRWTRSRPWIFAAIALVAAGLLTAGALLRLRSGADPVAASTTVAVLPFSFHGGPAWEYLGEGMAKLIGTRLDGVAGIRAVDPRALHGAVEREGPATTDPRRGPAIAARVGAGLYVLGHIVEAGDRLRITATLQRTGEAGGPVTEVTVEGEGASVFVLVDELTAQLLARSGAPRQLASIAARTTHSPSALLAFLEGEQQLLRGRSEPAAAAFRRAIEADTTFALAHYGLSRTAHWLVLAGGRDDGIDGATRHAGRLGPLDRTLVHAWDAYRRGDAAVADSLYRAVVREQPDHVEAWLQLAEVGFHFGSMLGRPAAESREAFERVLAYEPDNAGALIHLARLAAQAGELAVLDSLVERIIDLGPAAQQVFLVQALRSIAFEEPDLPEAVQAWLDYAPFPQLQYTLFALAAHSRDLERVAAFGDELTNRQGSPVSRAEGHLALAHIELARGRRSAAEVRLDSVASLVPGWDAEFRAAFNTLAPLGAEDSRLRAARTALADAAPPQVPASILSVAPSGYQARRQYLLGLLGIGRDDDGGQEHLSSLEAFAAAATAQDSAFSRRFALDLLAEQAAREGRSLEALALLGPPAPQPDLGRPRFSSYYKANERWLRAELLSALGRDDEGLRIYASFPDPDAYDLIYVAPAHLRRAEIHSRRGEDAQAAEHYGRFLHLWRDADPELQPLVAEARDWLTAQTPSPR